MHFSFFTRIKLKRKKSGQKKINTLSYHIANSTKYFDLYSWFDENKKDIIKS